MGKLETFFSQFKLLIAAITSLMLWIFWQIWGAVVVDAVFAYFHIKEKPLIVWISKHLFTVVLPITTAYFCYKFGTMQKKSDQYNFEELARTLDEVRNQAEGALNELKGNDKEKPIWLQLNPIQGMLHTIGLGLKKMYPQEKMKIQLAKNEEEIKKSRLDNWVEFIGLKICQGKKLYTDATLSKEITLKWFDEVLSGFRTAMKEGKYEYVNRLGPYYGQIKNGAEYNLKTQTSVRGCQNTVQLFLQVLEEYRDQRPPITDLDLRAEFNPIDLKKYEGEKCP